MIKRSKLWIAAFLAANMVVSQPAMVLAQDVTEDFEEISLEAIDEEYSDTTEETDPEGDFEALEDLEEQAPEEIVLDEEEGEEDSELQESGIISGEFTLSAQQKRYKNNVIEHASEVSLDLLEAGKDYMDGEVITFATSRENAEIIAKAYHGTLKDYGYGVATISLDDSDYTVAEAYLAGMNIAELPAVEPNYVIRLTDPVGTGEGDAELTAFGDYGVFSPADWETVHYDWGINDPALNPDNNGKNGYTYQWFHDVIHSYSAWAVSTGNPEIRVAVIDTGVRSSHEELAGKVINPTDLEMNYPHIQDNTGHGTHVAAAIAAELNNGKGGAGVAPDVSILAINASLYNETINDYQFMNDDLVKAILYVAGYDESGKKASDRKAEIINMSIGGPLYASAVNEAVQVAYREGVTVVAAMGNEYANCKSYPAAYENVIAVAAVGPTGARTNFSNSGSWCTVAAPGEFIYSAYNEGDSAYVAWDGTSMATPIVAGACALYMSVNGYTTPDDMKKVVQKSASKSSSKSIGAGIIDVAKMIGGDVSAPTVTVTDKEGKVIGSATGDTLTVKGVQSIDTMLSIKSNNFGGDEDLNRDTVVVFSLNGKDPALKNGLLTNGYYVNYSSWHDTPHNLTYYFSETEKQKNVTLKFATITGMGVISKISTVKITMEGTEDKGGYLYIQGQNAVPKGTSATFKAYLSGKAAKKVVWDIDDAAKENGVIIKNGKVTVPASFTGRSITIKVTSGQNSLLTASRSVNTPDYKVNSVMIDTIDAREFNNVAKDKKTGSVTAATVYSVDIDGEDFETDESVLYVSTSYLSKSGEYVTGSGFSMSSSNPKVARILFDEKGYSYVKGVSSGTAKITFSALDGSKKKATLKISVVTPASHVTVTAKNHQTAQVGYGASVTSVATVGSAYGKPSSTKVDWSYRIYAGYFDNEKSQFVYSDALSDSDTAAIMNTGLFGFSKGKLKVGKKSVFDNRARSYLPEGYEFFAFEAIATTKDGTNYSGSARYNLVNPCEFIIFSDNKGFINTNFYIDKVVRENGGMLEVPIIGAQRFTNFEVTSSNPGVLSAYAEGGYLKLIPTKKGNVSIKLRALDGTNKSTTINIRVE